MDEIDRLARVLREQFSDVTIREDCDWSNSALNVLDCVLSLNRRYDSFALPRVEAFFRHHPDVLDLAQLLELIDSYDSPLSFSNEELNYRDGGRAQVLRGVVEYLIGIESRYTGSTELERLHAWAISVTPSDAGDVGVRGFGLSGFQYLRMLFGAQTTKPDRHILRFVSEVVGRNVSPWTAIVLLEDAANRAGLPVRAVDHAIWEQRAREQNQQSERHCG